MRKSAGNTGFALDGVTCNHEALSSYSSSIPNYSSTNPPKHKARNN